MHTYFCSDHSNNPPRQDEAPRSTVHQGNVWKVCIVVHLPPHPHQCHHRDPRIVTWYIWRQDSSYCMSPLLPILHPLNIDPPAHKNHIHALPSPPLVSPSGVHRHQLSITRLPLSWQETRPHATSPSISAMFCAFLPIPSSCPTAWKRGNSHPSNGLRPLLLASKARSEVKSRATQTNRIDDLPILTATLPPLHSSRVAIVRFRRKPSQPAHVSDDID
jgi:hypothetical protein